MTEYSSNFYSDSNPELIEKFEEMLRLQKSYFFDVEEIEILADYYLDRGSYHKAKKAVAHGLSLFPKTSALLLKQAHTLVLGKKPVKALEILNYLEAAEPTNTEMLLFKAVVHRNLSDFEGTKSCLMKALETASENQEDIYLDLAFEQEMVEDYEGAIESLKKSLEINPEHEPSLFELGYCFDMIDSVEEGIEFFNNYIDEYPYSFVAWYNLSLGYEKLGLTEKAIEAIEFCLAIKDDFLNAQLLYGNMLAECDRNMEAIEAYTEALKFDPSSPVIYAAIGECYERTEMWQDAEYNYRKALDINPDSIDALMGMGSVREFEQKYNESINLYKRALALDELNQDNWHIYAELLVKLERYTEAEEAYKKLLSFFSDDEDAWIALAEVEAKLHDSITAFETLQKVALQFPSSMDIKWYKIKHLILSGNIETACQELSDALSIEPSEGKNFINIFPESILIPNIADLLDLYTQPQRKDEL